MIRSDTTDPREDFCVTAGTPEKPDEVGPIGDFWRVWRGEATIKENILTINVEGAEPVVINVVNPPDLPAHQAANNANDDAKDPQKPGETGQQ